ncbi:MAG: site-specific integrase [Saprospiraceae bacterium]
MTVLKPIQYNIVFNRKNRLNKHGEATIQIRCYQNRKSKFFATGIYIAPEYWNKKRQEINTKHDNALILNQRIANQLQAMREYEMTMIKRHGIFSVETIGDYVHFKDDGCFSDFFAEQIEANTTLKKGTVKIRRGTLKKLLTFNKNKKVYFSQITFRFISGFDRYLYSIGLATNSVETIHKTLKIYLNLAIKYDLMEVDKNPYKKFTPKTAPVEREFLLPNELTKIENLTFSIENEALEGIRDMFLFSCYTGLRYSDVRRVSKAHLTKSQKGYSLKYTAKKTNKTLILPLYALFRSDNEKVSKPEKLIHKLLEQRKELYKTSDFDGFPFFDYSNQYSNRELKKIAKLAGIKKSLTTHFARRSFATMAALKVPAPLLQQMMQHSNPRETALYISNNPLILASELEKIEW